MILMPPDKLRMTSRSAEAGATYLVDSFRICPVLANAYRGKLFLDDLEIEMVLPRLFFAFLMTVLATVNAQPQSAPSSMKPLTVGVVKDDSEFDGCGCSLYLRLADERRHRAIFLSDPSGNAVINLNPKNMKFRLMDKSIEKKGNPRIGDRSWEMYKSGDAKLRIDYTIRKLCDPNDESCEVTYYNATITLN